MLECDDTVIQLGGGVEDCLEALLVWFGEDSVSGWWKDIMDSPVCKTREKYYVSIRLEI